MSTESLGIRMEEFERARATEADVAALNRFDNTMEAEAWPEDPPITLEATRRGLIPPPSFVRQREWLLRRADGEIVARAGTSVWDLGSNEHAAGFGISILPELRRRRLATMLLRQVAEVAAGWERRLLLSGSMAAVPAGESFLRRIGAREAQREHLNQLDLRAQDPDALRALLREWQERAEERAGAYRLEFWDDGYTEERLEEAAAMKEGVNLMPRGSLEMEDEHVTPAHLRESEARRREKKQGLWTLVAREPEAGKIAGYTELHFDPEQPAIVWQGDTAVFTEHQNRGLGRWLKAVMLEKLMQERPEVTRIRTGNAETNAPMLGINHALGFRLYRECSQWQVDLPAVREYLAAA